MSSMNPYALQISGRIQRLKETLIGVPIAVHRWIIYGSEPLWLLILIFTDLILSPAKFYSPTGWEHGYGPLSPAVAIYGIYLLLCHAFILYRGIKTASNSIEKNKIINYETVWIGAGHFLLAFHICFCRGSKRK